jgi:hypothetical protein
VVRSHCTSLQEGYYVLRVGLATEVDWATVEDLIAWWYFRMDSLLLMSDLATERSEWDVGN